MRHIILFDGVCNLCNGAVRFIIKHDKQQVFRFAPLQSDAGKELLWKGTLPENNMESFVYIKGDKYYQQSDAVLQVARTLGGVWKLLYVFVVLPRAWRDMVYKLISGNRYRLFGKREYCMTPTPELENRFL
ncbi:MAG: thiol-disulfide oxidoreductase DCC family protein [Niabella sp.]